MARKPKDDGRTPLEITREAFDLLMQKDEEGNYPVPSPDVQSAFIAHFQDHPFDLIYWGALFIVDKDTAEIVRLFPNDEQMEILEYVVYCWDHKLPIRYQVLKARQIGSSTLAMAILFVLLWRSKGAKPRGHLITHLADACKNLSTMVREFRNNLPEWLRPEEMEPNNDKRLGFQDKRLGLSCELFSETAERRDKISRSGTFLYNVFSELPFWAEQMTIRGAIKPTIPRSPRSLVIEEGTGNVYGDQFHENYKSRKAGDQPGWKTFFFPWFAHREYQRHDWKYSEQEFWDGLCDDDQQRMKAYNLTVAQMHWYVSERNEYMRKGESQAVFTREYPSNEEEAFLGGGGNVFDNKLVDKDKVRIGAYKRVYDLGQLNTSTTYKNYQGVINTIRCRLITDADSGYRNPVFIADATGPWTLFENPRKGHGYVGTADPAEGKTTMKGVKSTQDYSSLGIWRYTYQNQPDREGQLFEEKAVIVQVAQFRDQKTDPREAARQLFAASIIYSGPEDYRGCPVCPERNSAGAAFVEQGKDDGMNFTWQTSIGAHNEVYERGIGVRTSGGQNSDATKAVLVTQLNSLWSRGYVQINSAKTAEEMGVYIKSDRGKYEASSGNHDDTVSEAYLMPEAVKHVTKDVQPVPLDSKTYMPQGFVKERSNGEYTEPPKLVRPKPGRWGNLELPTKQPQVIDPEFRTYYDEVNYAI